MAMSAGSVFLSFPLSSSSFPGSDGRAMVRCHAESATITVSKSLVSSLGSTGLHVGTSLRKSSRGSIMDTEISLSALEGLQLAASKVSMNQATAAQALALAKAARNAAQEAKSFVDQSAVPHSRTEECSEIMPPKGINGSCSYSPADDSDRSVYQSFLQRQNEVGLHSADIDDVDTPKAAPAIQATFHAPPAFKRALEKARARKDRLAGVSGSPPAASSVRGSRSRGKKSIVSDSMADVVELESLLSRMQAEELESSWEVPSYAHTRQEQIASQELKRARLLTGQEELMLAKGIQQMLKLERVKEALASQLGKPPTRCELARAVGCSDMELEKRFVVGRECKQMMVKHNLRLVYSVAKNYLQKGVNLDDLVTDGCKGLIRGLEKFDHTKGFKFSTYAHWWIRQAVSRSVTEQSRTIRLPAHLYELVSRIFKAKEMIQEEYRRPATAQEIASLVGISVAKLTATLESLKKPKLMSTKLYRDSEETIGDVLADPNEESQQEEMATLKLLKDDINNVLHTLNPRERDVMKLRYGLDDGKPKTLEEVGLIFQVTRERIRQIETKALRKLRQPSRNRVLQEYIGNSK